MICIIWSKQNAERAAWNAIPAAGGQKEKNKRKITYRLNEQKCRLFFETGGIFSWN
jgi:hypothetical protein